MSAAAAAAAVDTLSSSLTTTSNNNNNNNREEEEEEEEVGYDNNHNNHNRSTSSSFLRTATTTTTIIGSTAAAAVGYGNIWRFPSLVYSNGNGSIVFMILYFIGLLLIGIPLLINELILSSYYLQQQTGPGGGSGGGGGGNEINVHHYLINKHTKGIGFGCLLCGLIVSMYYVTLISWCIQAFIESFVNFNDFVESSSSGDDGDGDGDGDGSDATAISYFFHNVINQYMLNEDQRPTQIIIINIIYLALTWILVGFRFGFIGWNNRTDKNKSHYYYISYYMVTYIPILMLFIIMIRSLTLPGAYSNDYGIKKYFSIANISNNISSSILINQPDIWSTSISQIFFSIGITFGVMTVFGSKLQKPLSSSSSTISSSSASLNFNGNGNGGGGGNNKNGSIIENSFLIVLINTCFSLLSGISAMAIIGYTTQEIDINFRLYTGPALLFGAYPAALLTIPGGIHWVRFFFLTLILLGLNSSFALLEGIMAALASTKQGVYTVIIGICTVGFLGGIIFTTDTGLIFIDTIDFYMNYVVLFLGFCKALSTGWIYGMSKQVQHLGNKWNIVYMYFGTTFSSFLFASLVWFGCKGNTFWLGLFSLVVIYGSGICYCSYNLRNLVNEDNSLSMKFLRNELLMGNINELRTELSSGDGGDGGDGYYYLPWTWAFLMKHFIPQALLVLFINLFFAQTDYGTIEFGNYNGYEIWPYQFLGVSTVLFVMGVVFIGVLNSKLFDFLVTDPSLLKKKTTGTGILDIAGVEMEDKTNNDNMNNQDDGESKFNYLYMENLEKKQSEMEMNTINTTATATAVGGYGEDTTLKATDGVLA